jgi:hypothetical protein
MTQRGNDSPCRAPSKFTGCRNFSCWLRTSAAVFPRSDVIETMFIRFRMVDGGGTAAIYSHRGYGHAVGDRMSNWLRENGPEVQRALMTWNIPPVPDTLQGQHP